MSMKVQNNKKFLNPSNFFMLKSNINGLSTDLHLF